MSRLLTRRAALSGSTLAALGFVAAPALATVANTTSLGPNDARLVALADAMEAIHREAEAHIQRHRGRETDVSEAEFADISGRYCPAEAEMAATPADTLAGVLAKARAAQLPAVRAFDDCPFGLSLADDVWRLFGGAA